VLKVPNRIVWKVPPRWLAWWPLVWRKDLERCQAACQDALVELTEAKLKALAQDQREHELIMAKIVAQAERDQIRAELEKAKDNRIFWKRQDLRDLEKCFMYLRKRSLEDSNNHHMWVEWARRELKGLNDVSLVTEDRRENPNRGIDHDHPGASEGGQGAYRNRGTENHPCHQAGSPQA
jgi:hypothetical protein